MGEPGIGHPAAASSGGGCDAPGHVLVIEDEPNIAEAMRYLLQREGWRVTVDAGGRETAGMVRQLSPDLLVLDVMLPGISGVEVLAALRADPATATLPVLMLTARSQGRDRAEAEAAGADLFMAKPFANAAFLEAVRGLARVTRE
ncbi:MAG: response regulator [Paracoccaceae bacterium]|nr:MAG: response regulator [Paracoccaceae bacterium]